MFDAVHFHHVDIPFFEAMDQITQCEYSISLNFAKKKITQFLPVEIQDEFFDDDVIVKCEDN